MRRLWLGGARRGVVGVDFLLGGGAEGVSALGHRVVDVAAEEGGDVLVVKGVADVGVGDAVLDGAQVDVRERRLVRGADDTGHPGQLVGQGFVEHDVARIGTFFRFQDPQQAIPFPQVQRQEVQLSDDVFVEHEVDSRLPEATTTRAGYAEAMSCVTTWPSCPQAPEGRPRAQYSIAPPFGTRKHG